MVRALPAAAKRRDSSLCASAGYAGCFVLARFSPAWSARPSPDEALAERALELVEEPFGFAVGVAVGMLVEIVQETALLIAEAARYEDVDEDPLVAAPS